MKRIIIFFLMCILLIMPAYAEGDPNVSGGDSGGMHSGSGSSWWNPGWDGVRVTVVTTDGQQVCTPIDLTNEAVPSDTLYFGKYSKLNYLNSLTISPDTGDYVCYNPTALLPTIINSSGENNIDAIRSYFTDQAVLIEIAEFVGMSHDDLISGKYKLLIEPIAYFTYHDLFYAMTATEAALFDVMTGNGLRSTMPSLTHQNLPLSMFLEKDDPGLTLTAWTGATSGKQSDADIINFLGVGVINFTDESTVPEPQADYVYHTNTDVITTISFTNTMGEISPDNPAWMVFTINGTTYSKEFICPQSGHQMVWVRWHTPDTPQVITVHASCPRIRLSADITCNVVELTENIPPDPGFYDPSVAMTADVPDYGSTTSTTWGEWFARWHANMVWVPTGEDSGYWKDEGWWDWNYEIYTAKLEVDYELTPDNRVKTAYQSNGKWEMKSGYGVDATCKAVVTTSEGVSTYDTTDVQNVVAVFPEFNYDTYNRLLQNTGRFHGYDVWEFKTNNYSYYDERVHFTPLWYPDNTEYTVPLRVIDSWTPGGQLTATVSSSITIDGDMYDDWYIRTLK